MFGPSGGLHRSSVLTSRRALLGGLVAGALSGCSSSEKPAEVLSPSSSTNATGPIVWANWPDYIDVTANGKRRPTLAGFIQESGINVEYKEVINDNAEFIAGIGDDLKAKRPVGYDVLTLTSWAAARLVESGWTQSFGPTRNAENLIPALAAPDWDPDQTHSMPWQAGLTGIAYDARKVDRAIGSVAELFERPDLRGRVGVLTESSDTVGLTLLSQGKDLADLTPDDIDGAVAFLTDQAGAGRFAGFYGNDFIGAIADGEVAASMAWSGDVLQAQTKNPYLKFVIPEEGLMIWSDNLIVPKASTQAGAVAELAAYFYQPEVAARVAAWVNYICPVAGAQAEMERIDPDLAQSPLIFPDRTILDRSFLFPTLPEEVAARLDKGFADAQAAVPA